MHNKWLICYKSSESLRFRLISFKASTKHHDRSPCLESNEPNARGISWRRQAQNNRRLSDLRDWVTEWLAASFPHLYLRSSELPHCLGVLGVLGPWPMAHQYQQPPMVTNVEIQNEKQRKTSKSLGNEKGRDAPGGLRDSDLTTSVLLHYPRASKYVCQGLNSLYGGWSSTYIHL